MTSALPSPTERWTARIVRSEHALAVHMALPELWSANGRVGPTLVRRGAVGTQPQMHPKLPVLVNANGSAYALVHQADRLSRSWFDAYGKWWVGQGHVDAAGKTMADAASNCSVVS